jgi:hypothetical protein
MSQKRMFSKQIIDSDAFLDMSPTAQLLYFHLVMRADDEGFVGNPKKIMREVGIQGDDFKILVAKRFLLVFESGVVVIKHWLIHNTIRMDRFNPTTYQDEKNLIKTKENKAYTELATTWQPDGNRLETQVKLSEVKLIKEDTLPLYKSVKYLKEIPEADVKELTKRFEASSKDIKNKAESLLLYCQSKGKSYKDYKAFLLNAVKKDFQERKIVKIVTIDEPVNIISDEQKKMIELQKQEISKLLSMK